MTVFKSQVAGWLLIPLLACSFLAQAMEFKEGVHYQALHKGPVSQSPRINEFFSFACPACRTMETYLADIVAKKPENVALIQTHVDFVGGKPLGPELSKGWAIAQLLEVTDTIKEPLYQAVQDQRAIRDGDDVRQLFIDQGIAAKDYDAAEQSFMLKGQLAQMQKAAKDKKIRGVPTFVVNGKYQVLTKELKSGEELTQLILWLVDKQE